MKIFYTRKKALFYALALFTSTMQGQIGINIQNPSVDASLHIKGDITNTTNVTDELMINNTGNVGIGTINPSAKLEIINDGTTSPMRIVDGKVKINQIITSDADGNIQWSEIPTTGGTNYYLTGTSIATYNSGTYYLVNQIDITSSGLYTLLLRWWGRVSSYNVNNASSAVFYITVSNTTNSDWASNQTYVVDSSEEYVTGQSGTATANDKTVCFTKAFTANATAGSYMRLYIKVTNAGPWILRGAGTTQPSWIPSIVLFRI